MELDWVGAGDADLHRVALMPKSFDTQYNPVLKFKTLLSENKGENKNGTYNPHRT